jgi:hypothetical protein
MKVAWILGAGFSRPLGGPLLNDLFGGSLYRRMNASMARRGQSADRFRELHDVFAPHDSRTGSWHLDASRPWANAEEFIDLLESAAETKDPALLKLLEYDECTRANRIDQTARHARAYLAAATHFFVPQDRATTDRLESWRPYRTWAECVEPRDAIITFNYDLVPETVIGRERLWIATSERTAIDQSKVALLKLHGSVSWVRALAGNRIFEADDPYETLGATDGRDFVLGVPGPSKVACANGEDFRAIWEHAEQALTDADVIVMIGYRFAETDNEAKRRLLGAISRNTRPKLTLRIVLGLESPDSHRVAGMLRWALRKRGIILGSEDPQTVNVPNAYGRAVLDVVPMWSQDFLTVARREHLAFWG